MDYATALVTGASRGIGAAVVERLRGLGLEVHAAARPSQDLDAVAARTGAIPHACDVTNRSELVDLATSLEVDVLVNNAGVIGDFKTFQDSDPESIDRSLDTNLRAALVLTNLLVGDMLAQGRGHVFFVGSIVGRLPIPNAAVYGATKAALWAFADGLRLDLLGTPVRATVVAPGRVETHLYDDVLGSHASAREKLYDNTSPLQPSDIADAIANTLQLAPHVDVTMIEVMPTNQAYGGSATG